MAVGKINLSLDADELRQMKASLGKLFDNKGLSDILGEALEKAIWPVFLRLREVTPEGPTGNLRRAIDTKVREYPLDGNAVGLVGFRKTGRGRSQSAAGGTVRRGPDRAFHQYWLEEGTNDRVIDTLSRTPYLRKSHRRVTRSGTVTQVAEHTVIRGQGGYIASSFNRLGPFGFSPTERGTIPQRVQTQPGYPNAFFKKSGTPIRIPPMPVGGSTGRPPLATAWANKQAEVREVLARRINAELAKKWENLGTEAA